MSGNFKDAREKVTENGKSQGNVRESSEKMVSGKIVVAILWLYQDVV